MTNPRPLSCDQTNGIPSATRVAGRPLAQRQWPDTRFQRMSAPKRRDAGAFAATAGLVAQPQEGPSQGPPREPCGLSGPHGPGVAFRHPRSAISVPGPHFEIRHSPAAPHGRLNVGRLIRSTEAATTHDIAAARATAIGPGLLDLSPPTEGLLPGAGRCRVRCWIQTPRRWQRRAHHCHSLNPPRITPIAVNASWPRSVIGSGNPARNSTANARLVSRSALPLGGNDN
jgi:hypothetical protein